MTLILTLQGSRTQSVRQMRLDEGVLVIGRGADVDWRIDDPDMFVSRAHCKITGDAAGFTVTDTSSGGLYIDDARNPLGSGNSAPLIDGMRLRLGDYQLRVAISGAAPAAARVPAMPRPPAEPEADDFFAAPVRSDPAPKRPPDLPDQFEKPVASRYFAPEPAKPERAAPPAFDDPFTLDAMPTPRAAPPASNGFDWGAPASEPVAPPNPQPNSPPSGGFGWDAPAIKPQPAPPQPVPRPPAAPARAQQAGADSAELLAAFLRGLGLDPADAPQGDPVAQMEAFGRDYRLMLEGLMHLLRKRSQEKSNARIAQTIVGATEVNPLKFMPTVDDALLTLLAERSPGFLGPEAAITGAVRDLAQHHVDAWRGVQSALAAMVRRFDPASIEEELKDHSALATLFAGGRRAKLWELYEERYREIAKSAETRFLGEVGADFRDAYENNRGD